MTNEEQIPPLQQAHVSRCPDDVTLIETLRKQIADKQQEIYEANRKLKECADEYRQMVSWQVAQLRAVQMLYDVMAAGYTHNQKSMFAEVAKETLSREMGNLIDRYRNSRWKFSADDMDLPF